MADYSDIISQYGGAPAGDYSDIISQYGGVPERKAVSPVFEKPFFGTAPKTGEEAVSNLLDIGTLLGGGAAIAGMNIAREPMKPAVEMAKGVVGLPLMAGQAAMGDVAAREQLRSFPANVLADYARAYGSPQAAYMTAVTEPSRFAMDVSTLPALGSTAARVAGRAIGTSAEAAQAGARNMIGRVLPISSDEAAIQNRLAALTGPVAPADIRAAYEQGVQIPRTPGMPAPSLAEATAAGGVELPGLAALEKSYGGVETPAGRAILERPQQQAAAIRDQLARVDATIQERAGALSPEELANPRIIRDVPLRNLAEERKALESKLGALQRYLPSTDLYERGVSIQAAAKEGEKLASQEMEDIFKKPFAGKWGRAKENIAPVVKQAENILADPTAEFSPATVPGSLAEYIAKQRPQAKGDWVSLGEGAGYYAEPTEAAPVMASFRSIGKLNKAINAELSSVFRASPNDVKANTRKAHLLQLKKRLTDIVESSETIPQEARTAWKDANKAFVDKIVKPYRTGVSGDLFRTNIKNETVLPPDTTVAKFLSDGRNARQFATTFGDNPAVMSDVNDAILAMARKEAVTDGIVDPKALASFVEKYREPLDVIGSDVNDIISQVQRSATRMQTGIAKLTEQAKALKETDWRALVDRAEKSSQEMSFLKERLRKSPEALEALAKEVSDRVLENVTAGEPKAALKKLSDQRRAIIGAVGKEQYDALRALAEDQLQLKEVSKTAPSTDAQLRADISGYSAAQKNDIKLAIDDLARMKQMERLSAKAPANLGEKAAEEVAFQWYNPLSYPYNLIHATQRFLQKRQNARVSARLARDLYENPERVLTILEQGTTKPRVKTTPPSAESKVPAVVGAVNVLSRGQNRNAMSRQ
jgi:hypothetical protein